MNKEIKQAKLIRILIAIIGVLLLFILYMAFEFSGIYSVMAKQLIEQATLLDGCLFIN